MMSIIVCKIEFPTYQSWDMTHLQYHNFVVRFEPGGESRVPHPRPEPDDGALVGAQASQPTVKQVALHTRRPHAVQHLCVVQWRRWCGLRLFRGLGVDVCDIAGTAVGGRQVPSAADTAPLPPLACVTDSPLCLAHLCGPLYLHHLCARRRRRSVLVRRERSTVSQSCKKNNKLIISYDFEATKASHKLDSKYDFWPKHLEFSHILSKRVFNRRDFNRCLISRCRKILSITPKS